MRPKRRRLVLRRRSLLGAGNALRGRRATPRPHPGRLVTRHAARCSPAPRLSSRTASGPRAPGLSTGSPGGVAPVGAVSLWRRWPTHLALEPEDGTRSLCRAIGLRSAGSAAGGDLRPRRRAPEPGARMRRADSRVRKRGDAGIKRTLTEGEGSNPRSRWTRDNGFQDDRRSSGESPNCRGFESEGWPSAIGSRSSRRVLGVLGDAQRVRARVTTSRVAGSHFARGGFGPAPSASRRDPPPNTRSNSRATAIGT